MPKKQTMVMKSNKLVQASYRLSLVEQQIILFAIAKAREEQTLITPNTVVKIRAIEFAEMFSHEEANVYRDLKAAAKRLSKRQLSIKDMDPATGYERCGVTNWTQHADYVPKVAEIQIAFTMKIIPYITRLGPGYTKYVAERVAGMTSTHGIRFYELMTQYRASGTRTIKIPELREMMQLDPSEYKLLANLKRRVIDEGIKQVNAHSDLEVDYKQSKAGREIDALIFTIKVKPEYQPEPKLPAIDDAYIKQHARPNENVIQAGARLRAERAALKKPAKKEAAASLQMELPEIAQNPDSPLVKEARAEALALVKNKGQRAAAKAAAERETRELAANETREQALARRAAEAPPAVEPEPAPVVEKKKAVRAGSPASKKLLH